MHVLPYPGRGLLRLALGFFLVVSLVLAVVPVVPIFVSLHTETIRSSAERHGIAPEWLTAVLYNEMLGQEDRLLHRLMPGDGPLAQGVRNAALGWHFLTLKQVQWWTKAGFALAGSDTTLGPTGIRVSVGREIRAEESIGGGHYVMQGWLERPSLVLDLAGIDTSIEYLAANLERGQERAGQGRWGDWRPSARWHNTGLVADRPDVPRPIWDKGTRYVARVEAFLPQSAQLLAQTPSLVLEAALQRLLARTAVVVSDGGRSPVYGQPASAFMSTKARAQ